MGMLYFLLAAALLFLGYAIYGLVVEKIFGIDRCRPTPVQTQADGVDSVALPAYKIFFIQLLNIAGLGPVFGPIMGAVYGPSALLWVVFGCVFAGAVHDFLTGAMSLRYGGASYPEVIGRNLGPYVRWFMLIFTIWFMILVGAVFVNGPAGLLSFKTQELLHTVSWGDDALQWLTTCPLANFCRAPDGSVSAGVVLTIVFSIVIFAYYFMATILPIDKIIGRIYPFFAILLLFMAVGLFLALLFNPAYTVLPNIRLADFFTNLHPKDAPLWPLLFVTIACGAISGFHATQSPMMARCMQSEGQARTMFYGVMIAEGFIALIWVTIGLSFYDGDPQALLQAGTPAVVVAKTSEGLLGGILGGTLVFLGVVILPISTGDTAFRTGRLILADMLHVKQTHVSRRIAITIPLFALGIYFAVGDFKAIWMAFGWTNQTLACVSLWAAAVWLRRRDRQHWIATLPALFMTSVCGTYLFCYDRFPFRWSSTTATCAGIAIAALCFAIFLLRGRRMPDGDEAGY
ncbi:MAG: carbon starvation protein A [Desulfovibrio sp.]|nr:carbon starvation protein A [Desulfovibrio sp.]